MYFSERITLRTVTSGTDSDGFPTQVVNTDVEVWGNKRSVTRSEFYAANQKGINLSTAFDVNPEDYNNQKVVVHNGSVYKVVRAYQSGEGRIELNCAEGE